MDWNGMDDVERDRSCHYCMEFDTIQSNPTKIILQHGQCGCTLAGKLLHVKFCGMFP